MKEIRQKDYYNEVLGSWIGLIAGDIVGTPVELKIQKYIQKKYEEISYYRDLIEL